MMCSIEVSDMSVPSSRLRQDGCRRSFSASGRTAILPGGAGRALMSAVALLSESHASSDDEIREQMSGNICRCGAYPNILAAIRAVRSTR